MGSKKLLLGSSGLLFLHITYLPVLAQNIPQYSVNQVTTNIAGDLTDIYYPVGTNGDFPVVVFLTGALVQKDNYVNFAESLASYGFITAVSNHVQVIPAFNFDGQLPELSQVTDTFAYLKQEDNNSDSPFFMLVDEDKLGAVGHSHGGGAVLRGSEGLCQFPFCSGTFEQPPELKAVVGFGTNRFNPFSNMYEPTNNTIPVALIQGSLDGIATTEEAENTYPLIQPTKALITIDGANHYSITDINNPSGATPDPQSATLEQTEGIELTALWTALFLLTHLEENSEASGYIYGDRNSDPRISIVSQTVPESDNILGLVVLLLLGFIKLKK